MSFCQSTFINRDRPPRSAPLPGAEGLSARGLHSCGPVQGSSRRSVTATLRFARHRGRTLVRTKFIHENNLCKPAPANLLRKTKSQSFAVQSTAVALDDIPMISNHDEQILHLCTLQSPATRARYVPSMGRTWQCCPGWRLTPQDGVRSIDPMVNLCVWMYVAFQQISPGTDVGIDFSREYAAALSLGGLTSDN